MPPVNEQLLELAEEPGLWLPPEPKLRIERRDGFALVLYGRSAWVHHVRLGAIEPAVGEVRALAAAAGIERVSSPIHQLTRSIPAAAASARTSSTAGSIVPSRT